MSLEDGLPFVRADAALLEQVLFNLLDNAHKYSPPESITRIAARLAPDGALRITITDDGIGIPEEALGKVFGKFYRVAGGDGRAPGTGLGLSIAAALVSAMGGTITATSPAGNGKGTEVAVVLPTRGAGLEPNSVPRATA